MRVPTICRRTPWLSVGRRQRERSGVGGHAQDDLAAGGPLPHVRIHGGRHIEGLAAVAVRAVVEGRVDVGGRGFEGTTCVHAHAVRVSAATNDGKSSACWACWDVWLAPAAASVSLDFGPTWEQTSERTEVARNGKRAVH